MTKSGMNGRNLFCHVGEGRTCLVCSDEERSDGTRGHSLYLSVILLSFSYVFD